ncbi:MAG: type II secretion system secretin GspD [Geminicoccales bacterium]
MIGPALTGLAVGCVAEKPVPSDPGQFTERPSVASPLRAVTEPRSLFQVEAGGDGVAGFAEPLVEFGTEPRLGRTKSRARVDMRRGDTGDITLNVVDAEIRDVIRLVLEDALGVNYTIDPAITGSITVRTSRPIPPEDAIATLGSILSLNGAALIDVDGFYKIVPIDQAATAGGEPVGRTGSRVRDVGSGVQVVPLHYADAAQLTKLLKPFVGGRGSIQVDASRNILLLLGSPDQVATMTDLIDMFDVDWMRGMSIGIYPLEAVGASELADELDQILGDPEIGVLAGGVRLVPLERLSALVVIASEAKSLKRIQTWIERLDQPGEGQGDQVYVYEVQHARAADLATVLGELFDIKSTSIGEDQLLAPGLEPIELSAAPFGLGLKDDVDDDAVFDADDRRRRPGRGGKRGAAGRAPGTEFLTGGSEGSEARIVADEISNALLIRTTAEAYKKVRAALQELDKQPLQVLLEATIAEVTLKDELSYGVQWFFGSDESSVTLSEFGNGSVGQLFPGFSGLLSRGDVRVALNALDSVSEVNVISSPQILVLDNQTAQLEVGDEVPIVTQQAEGVETSDARVVNTVEQRQTGVILNVTPRVNANGQVVLDIRQEVSDVVRTTTSGIDSPTIAQRRINTSVAVSSDQTVVLGGLIQEDVEDINSGVPILKDIPGIGALFGATTKATSRTELLVLITPKVLTNQEEAVAATDELRRRFAALEPLQAKIRRKRIDGEGIEATELPEPVMVQLAAAANAKDAWETWHRLLQDDVEQFQDLQPRVVEAVDDTAEPFSLRVGPFNRPERVSELCSRLKGDRTDCHAVEAGG